MARVNGSEGPGMQKPELPAFVAERVAFDSDNNTVFVDQRTHGNPFFQTWLSQMEHHDFSPVVKTIELRELLEMKHRGLNLQNTDEDDAEQYVKRDATNLILLAAKYRASDVHFTVSPVGTSVQLVIKGELRAFKHLAVNEGKRMIRAIYQGIASSRAGSFNPLEFQNAQISGAADLPRDSGISSIRIVRGPCYPESEGGEFMTMRLQFVSGKRSTDSDDTPLPVLPYPTSPQSEFLLGKMGYEAAQVERIERILSAPSGIVLFVGPTGSGKTTSMFECLQEIARQRPECRLVTVEDPVEYPMSWAVQLSVADAKNEDETGDAFLERVRVMLRMAPHIILLGEIRGAEVATAALNAAITGHLGISTMHVNDPFLFVDRLEIMDRTRLNRRIFCDPKIIRGVIAQRLLPHLCPSCSRPAGKDDLPARIFSALNTWAVALGVDKQIRVKGPGCEACHQDGSIGRFAVAEIVSADDRLMLDFIEHGTAVARRNYRLRPDTDSSMLEKAVRMVLAGQVSPRDAEKFIDIIEPYQDEL